MAFDWNEYLTLARFLQQLSTTDVNQEASRRSAVSRAYFAIKLDMLRKWRNECDYEDSVNDLSVILPSAIMEAQKVIAILK